MRKSKKQLLRTLIACGLVVSVAAGGTVAYLTDAETATNTFTVGKVKIDLEEPSYPGNDSDEVKNIIPNQEIVKDPQIENTGNNDALVFIRVEIPQETFTDEDDGIGEQKKQDLFRLKGVSDQWELLRTETVAGEDGKAKHPMCTVTKDPGERRNHGQAVPEGTDEKCCGIRFERKRGRYHCDRLRHSGNRYPGCEPDTWQ